MTSRAARSPRYTVAHVITGLETGGAEMILLRLARGLAERDVATRVVSLKRSGSFIPEELAGIGVPVDSVMRSASPGDVAAGLPRLLRAVADARADVVQGWMYDGNLAASVARRVVAPRAPLAWSVHHTLTHLEGETARVRRSIALGRRWSRGPAAIHYVSHSSARQHREQGWCADRERIISNACDTESFRRDPDAASALRAELGLPGDALLVGHVAGARPQKDHGTLLAAHRTLVQRARFAEVHLVLAGPGTDGPLLDALLAEHPSRDRVHRLGERADVARLLSAFDLATLSSAWGESCPTVVLEAMACETPCVVTDVGDSARLVGSAGRVVAPRDASALAAAWAELLAVEPGSRRQLGATARARVVERYGIDEMVRAFDELYGELLARR